MPLITIEGPVIKDTETKRQLVKDITETVADSYEFPKETIVVLIKENSPENVGVGGQLVIDLSKPE